ncbi:MAG: hypothetical protein LBS15_00125 [Endomicrobium sp.]|jgi:superoxide reductase|nr:hypothetical protein [Endomicrobium sp.]
MRGVVCKVCGYVSLSENDVKCPVCRSRNVFGIKENAYKMLDVEAPIGELEKKHIPVFTIVEECGLISGSVCLDVHVKIGEVTHSMFPEHFISEITFYINNRFVENVMLTSNVNPAAVVHLKDSMRGKIQVIESCNLHGRWFSEVDIK